MNNECFDSQSVVGVGVGVRDYILLEHLVRERGPDNTGECRAGDVLQRGQTQT